MSLNDINREQVTNPRRKRTESEGQLARVAGMSHTEISFKIRETSMWIRNKSISDLISLDKVIQYFKTIPSYIKHPTLDLNSGKFLCSQMLISRISTMVVAKRVDIFTLNPQHTFTSWDQAKVKTTSNLFEFCCLL